MPGNAKQIDLIIRGINRVSAPIREVNKQIETMLKPVNKVRNALVALGKEARLPQLGAALASVGREFVALAKTAAFYGSLIGGAAVLGMRHFIDTADEIGATASKIGITTDALQELRYAGEQLDVSQQTLDTSLTAFSKNIVDVSRGTGRALFAFRALKINVRGVGGQIRPTTELMDEFSDKLAQIKDPAKQLRYTLAAFGNADLVNVLAKGSGEMKRFRQEARDLGFVLDQGTIAAAGEADNEIRRLSFSFRAVGNELGAAFLPLVVEVSEGMRAWIKENREWIKTDLVPALQAVATTALTILGPLARLAASTAGLTIITTGLVTYGTSKLVRSLFDLGTEIARNPFVAPRLLTALTKLRTVFTLLSTTALPALVTGLRAVGVALVANPIGIWVAAGAALIAIGYMLYGKWKPWTDLVDAVVETWRDATSSLGRFLLYLNPIAAAGMILYQRWKPFHDLVDSVVSGARSIGAATLRFFGFDGAGAPAAGGAGSPGAAAAYSAPRARDYVTPRQTVAGQIGIDIGLASGLNGGVRQLESRPSGFGLDVGMHTVGAT